MTNHNLAPILMIDEEHGVRCVLGREQVLGKLMLGMVS